MGTIFNITGDHDWDGKNPPMQYFVGKVLKEEDDDLFYGYYTEPHVSGDEVKGYLSGVFVKDNFGNTQAMIVKLSNNEYKTIIGYYMKILGEQNYNGGTEVYEVHAEARAMESIWVKGTGFAKVNLRSWNYSEEEANKIKEIFKGLDRGIVQNKMLLKKEALISVFRLCEWE